MTGWGWACPGFLVTGGAGLGLVGGVKPGGAEYFTVGLPLRVQACVDARVIGLGAAWRMNLNTENFAWGFAATLGLGKMW